MGTPRRRSRPPLRRPRRPLRPQAGHTNRRGRTARGRPPLRPVRPRQKLRPRQRRPAHGALLMLAGGAGSNLPGGSVGNQTWGPSSWFGGPNDKTTGPTTASGAPIGDPGIAVYNRSTLGGWWAIKAPNGSIGIVRQTDLGPSPSTGRKFDYTYSLLPLFGYSQQNFPTGGQTYGFYLGKSLTDISLQAPRALRSLGATRQQYDAFVHATDV